MFAGPNGSGKSVLKSYLPAELLGVYLNADDLESEISASGGINLEKYGVRTAAEEVLPFFSKSDFLIQQGRADMARLIQFRSGWLDFSRLTVDSYFASVLVDFLRRKLLEKGRLVHL